MNELEQEIHIKPPLEMFDITPIVYGPGARVDTPPQSIRWPEDGGVLVQHEGDKFPVKQFPYQEGINAADAIKRHLITNLHTVFDSPLRYVIPLFFILPKSIKRKIIGAVLRDFGDFSDTVCGRWNVYWKPKYYCTAVREIYRVGMKLAGPNVTHQQLVKGLCVVLENDDAYRYFFQDGAEVIDKGRFTADPLGEFTKMLKTIQERGWGVSDKIGYLILGLKLIPGFKEYLISFFKEVHLERLYLDEYDLYKCLKWGGYKFKGLSDKDKFLLRAMIDIKLENNETSTV